MKSPAHRYPLPTLRNGLVLALCALGGTSAACGSSSDDAGDRLGDDAASTAPDAATDANPDAVTDAAPDAPTDVATEVAPGPTSDANVSVTHPASFRTLDTNQYVAAAAGGVGPLVATGAVAGAAETFTLTDLNGGALVDGDEVRIATDHGGVWIAAGGGGGALTVGPPPGSDDATFAIVRLPGAGVVASGDRVALKTKTKGSYVSAIEGGGGEVRADAPWARAWETFTLTLDGATPPTPGASSPRAKVLDLLAGLSGKQTVAGQHNKYNSDPAGASDWIRAHTGKQPGLWSADFGFGSDAVDNRAKMIAAAKLQWSHGSLVQLMYHSCVPTRDELCSWDDVGGAAPQHLSDTQWTELVTDGTALNAAWKARLDGLSVFFADLQAAGIAPLFRPLHEMNQPVFWWAGRSGPSGTRKLFQLTHDYLVKTKGFDNIVWVWDVQDFSTLGEDLKNYDPGEAYYDIAALDVYDGGYDAWKYDAMSSLAGGKPIAIGECQTVPTSALLASQPRWSFFMLWPDFLDANASALPPLYDAANVLTEERMPGWK